MQTKIHSHKTYKESYKLDWMGKKSIIIMVAIDRTHVLVNLIFEIKIKGFHIYKKVLLTCVLKA